MTSPQPVLLTVLGPNGIPATFTVLNPAGDFSVATSSLPTIGFNYGFNTSNAVSWEPVQTGSASANGLVPTNNGNLLVVAQLAGLNPTSTHMDRVVVQPNNADALAVQATGNLANDSFNFGFNGATFDRMRVATVFNTAVATAAGNTPVWTPTAGKKFRLMGYTISVAGTLAATGVQTLKLEDGATVIKNHLANIIETPSASISGGDTQIGADLGQGQLSAAVNNVLSINLGTAMATGGVAVNVWGTEE